MKTTIGRTLFFFKDGRESLVDLNNSFFPLANFLNRLLSEIYAGKKIEFLNLDFSTERTYELFPVWPKGEGRAAYGHFHYYGVIDIQYFNKLEEGERARHVWQLAYQAYAQPHYK
ncbi:hypothetical protein [Pontibacter sp. BAB1700]|uniref:hypothetical protein n=1 Tax=Pontibacter sp. BAB1700 TaxID=1144253 RepID=UPI00026BCDB9|nr:hypothetical protein [Pontibacter sp. BAB1700]EJF10136.1 hypothetical protein O71_10899 [Pontibacter sp. BAB1700]